MAPFFFNRGAGPAVGLMGYLIMLLSLPALDSAMYRSIAVRRDCGPTHGESCLASTFERIGF